MKLSNVAALAFTIAASVPLAASAQPMMHSHFRHVHMRGRIVSVQGSDFTLDNGSTVFLKQGTVINPTGRRVHAGQYVLVNGLPAGNHNVNAEQIDIQGRHR